MLIDSLGVVDLADPAPYDMLSQRVGSRDCTSSQCLVATLQAVSTIRPFVRTIDFNQTITGREDSRAT